ncbi:hypothetical protein HOLleu_41000 [Holothuria leucospilota]|uniref:Uncharacterized protein n=1 Tax=Holothuria leucospilota TaxID=206669 RepID=A0A9Q1B9F9_HOLLE|nr:hypothetical protein HOLleu_41000 [Holothuria leucospilota]
MSHLENGDYHEGGIGKKNSFDGNMPDEIAVKVRWLQNNLVEGPQYGPSSVKVFREDVRSYLIKKFGGPVSDLEIGVVLRKAFPNHVRRGKFYCGIGKQNQDAVTQNHSVIENHTELKIQRKNVRDMSTEAADTMESRMPMKKRITIRDWSDENDKVVREPEKRETTHIQEKTESVHTSIPDQQLYKPNLRHPVPPTSHIVVAPSPVLPSFPQPFTRGVVQPSLQTPMPCLSLPTSVMDPQPRYFTANHYIPLDHFEFVRNSKRHDPGTIITDHPSPHKKQKKIKRGKEGRIDMPQTPKGIQGSMPQTSSSVQPIIFNFDVPLPKMPPVSSIEDRLPPEVKFSNLLGSQKFPGSSKTSGSAVQDHQVSSEQGRDSCPDSQAVKVPSQRYPSQSPPPGKPPPFIPKTSRVEDSQDHQHSVSAMKDVSPFKVPSIDQYKASTTGNQTSGAQSPLTCFICKNTIYPGSRDYPPVVTLIVTCGRCKKIAFGKKESRPASIPKFPAACNPRLAPSEEVSAIRRRTFWKCLINHHKSTKHLRGKRRVIPRVSVSRGSPMPRSVSSSVSGSYPASPQPMSPMSTSTAASPGTSLPPSPLSQTGMSLPPSPLQQLPSPGVSPQQLQEKISRSHSLHPPSGPEGQSSSSRPVNSPKISSSGHAIRRQADQTDERLDPSKVGNRQLSPGGSEVTSPDSISLPPGRENEDVTVRALLQLSSASGSESRNKLQVPGDIMSRRHSLPVSYEQRFSPRERPVASRLVDSTDNNQMLVQDYLSRHDLRYVRDRLQLESVGNPTSESNQGGDNPRTHNGRDSLAGFPKHRTFMISGQFVEGLRSDKPYEAFCCSCVKEEMVLIKCPSRGCEFVCNSVSGMELHEETHRESSLKKMSRPHSPQESRDGLYEDGASRSSVETQSADTDLEPKSPGSVSHFPHSSSRRDEDSTLSADSMPSYSSHIPGVSSSSVIDLGSTAHHVSIPRPNPPSLIPSSRVSASDPTSPLDLSGKRTPTFSRSPKENSYMSPSFQLGAPLDLSSQTKQGYSDIVSYQIHNREKEQFVSNQMLGSTGKVIERPSAPVANMMPSIQIPLPTTAVSLQTSMPTQLPTLVSPAPLPFFYTPFIYPPSVPASMGSAIPLSHPIIVGTQNSTSSSTFPMSPHPEKAPVGDRDREPKLYQGPFAFLNQVHAAARSRAAKTTSSAIHGASQSPQPATTNSLLHPGTPSPTSSSSSGSWHREKLRETSPANKSRTCSPQRVVAPHANPSSPHSVSYQGGTISIQSSPSLGHRRISPKTVKIESPFHQREASPSPSQRGDCPVQVKIEHCSDEDNKKEDYLETPLPRTPTPGRPDVASGSEESVGESRSDANEKSKDT